MYYEDRRILIRDRSGTNGKDVTRSVPWRVSCTSPENPHSTIGTSADPRAMSRSMAADVVFILILERPGSSDMIPCISKILGQAVVASAMKGVPS